MSFCSVFNGEEQRNGRGKGPGHRRNLLWFTSEWLKDSRQPFSSIPTGCLRNCMMEEPRGNSQNGAPGDGAVCVSRRLGAVGADGMGCLSEGGLLFTAQRTTMAFANEKIHSRWKGHGERDSLLSGVVRNDGR